MPAEADGVTTVLVVREWETIGFCGSLVTRMAGIEGLRRRVGGATDLLLTADEDERGRDRVGLFLVGECGALFLPLSDPELCCATSLPSSSSSSVSESKSKIFWKPNPTFGDSVMISVSFVGAGVVIVSPVVVKMMPFIADPGMIQGVSKGLGNGVARTCRVRRFGVSSFNANAAL